jgi:DNA adenine methylase
MAKKVKTPIIQAGGKTLLLDHYDKIVPKHDTLLDVFGGGGAILLWDEHPKGATYNDLNKRAANYWRVVRDRGKFQELLRLLKGTEYGREVFLESIPMLDDTHYSDIQRAWAWHVHTTQGFTHQESEVGWRMAKPSSMAATWARGIERMSDVHEAMQQVNIECLDWRDCLARYGNGGQRHLVVCDPPYLAPSDYTLTYNNPFTIEDHAELLWTVNKLDSMVIVCGYDSVLYQENLRQPKWELKKRIRQMMVKNSDYEDYGETREECMWLSVGDWREHSGSLWATELSSLT